MPKPHGKPKTSDITADVYVVAREEHATAAFELLDSRQFVLAHYVGIKGDLLTVRSRLIVNAAFDLVSLGVTKWKN